MVTRLHFDIVLPSFIWNVMAVLLGIVIKFKSQNINLHWRGSVLDNSTRIVEELPGPFRFLLQHAHQLGARKRVILISCL